MLPEDEALRSTDVPERLQLARGRDLRNFDPAAAAECAPPAPPRPLGSPCRDRRDAPDPQREYDISKHNIFKFQ